MPHKVYFRLWVFFLFLVAVAIVSAAEYGDHKYCADSEGGTNTAKADIAGYIDLSVNPSPSPGEIEKFNDYCQKGSEKVIECTGEQCYVQDYYCVPLSEGRYGYNLYFFDCVQKGFVGCKNGACVNDIVAQPVSCTDREKNQDEVDIDCGGVCPKCEIGKLCKSNFDCESNWCRDGACSGITTCADKIKNMGESDVDCGGICSTKCSLGKACLTSADCASSSCINRICTEKVTAAGPSCSDGIKNQGETDIDCGGTCAVKCDNGKRCLTSADCRSHRCDARVCREVPEQAVAVADEEDLEEEVTVSAEEDESVIAQADQDYEEDEAMLESGEEESGFFSRAWRRIRGTFSSEGRARSSDRGDLTIELGDGVCDKETLSGEDACDMTSRLMAGINSVWIRLSQRLDEDIVPRLEDLEEAFWNLRQNEIKKQVREEVKKILGGCVNENENNLNRFSERTFVSRYRTCKNYCENKGKICLMGIGDYQRYDSEGRLEDRGNAPATESFGCDVDPNYLLNNYHQVHCICC